LFYAAYGSNLNLVQMKSRCPKSAPYKKMILFDWKLSFKGVADIIPDRGSSVPIGIYKITLSCEEALDKYEDYPVLYKKHYLKIIVDGNVKKVLTYIIDKKYSFGAPPESYFKAIKIG